MSEQNKAVARRFYEEIFNKKNIAAIDQICDPKFVDHSPGPGQKSGDLAGVKQMFELMTTGFPDMQFKVEHLVADQDMVAAHFTVVATHKGPFLGAPPTGKRVTIHGVDLLKIVNGRAVESWHYGDEAMALAQLGIKG